MRCISGWAVGFCLAVIGFGTPALAQKKPKNEYSTQWFVDDSQFQMRVSHSEFDDFVLIQRLIPKSAAILDKIAISGTNGDEIAQKNSKLFLVKSVRDIIFCVDKSGSASAVKALFRGLGGKDKQYCLIDTNNDNRFDGYFSVGISGRGIPIWSERKVPKIKPLVPTNYKITSSADTGFEYFIAIRALNTKSKKGIAKFDLIVGKPTGYYGLSKTYKSKKELEENLVSIIGSKIQIDESDNLKATVLKSIPKQELKLEVSGAAIGLKDE